MTTEKTTDDGEGQKMRDIEHTPPDGDGARAVWERGGEEGPDEAEAEADRDSAGAANE